MTAEPTDSSDLPNGNPPTAKRRGRPKGSAKKPVLNLFRRELTRVHKVTDFYTPSIPTVRVGRQKKKRGRPRIRPQSDDESEGKASKRSKPRKNKQAKQAGRRRGSPAKSPSTNKKTRKRGRPRKCDADGSQQMVVALVRLPDLSPPINRRGRPPGSSNKSRHSVGSLTSKKGKPTAVKAATGDPSRKRGRPPGSKNLGKKSASQKSSEKGAGGSSQKRGRPPGSGTKKSTSLKRGRPSVKKDSGDSAGEEADEVAEGEEAVDAPPRKKGRPASVGKKKQAASRKEDDGPPRKRGRPKGRSSVAKEAYDGPPRKRGRPRKTAPVESSDEPDEHLQAPIEDDGEEEEEEVAIKEEPKIVEKSPSANGDPPQDSKEKGDDGQED